jgi:hypothetical protein
MVIMMLEIAGGIILAAIILANADTIVTLIGAALLITLSALLVSGMLAWGGPVLIFGGAGLALGYLFCRGLRQLGRDRILNRAQRIFGTIVCTLLLGVPAAGGFYLAILAI